MRNQVTQNYGKSKIANTVKGEDTLADLILDIGWISGSYHLFISKDAGSVIFANTGKFGVQQIPGFTNRL